MVSILKIVVRSKKDADAVKSAIGDCDSGVEVITLGGVRGNEFSTRLCEVLRSSDAYIIALLGRQEYEYIEECDPVPNSAIVMLGKRKVRNARLQEIIDAVNKGKAVLRNRVLWHDGLKVYLVNHGKGVQLDIRYWDPATDVFFIYGDSALRNLHSLLGYQPDTSPLVVRSRGGVHKFFIGKSELAEIVFTEHGIVPQVNHVHDSIIELDTGKQPDSTFWANLGVVELAESISIRFLRNFVDEEVIVVPWSGGKDSTAALLLAIKAFGKHRVKAVYVDTGVDFSANAELINEVSELLGIDTEVLHAPVLKEIDSGRQLPTHQDRWCTVIKTEALYKFLRSNYGGRVALIVGDRDAESRTRSSKPFVEWRYGIKHLYPIKLWSTLLVQAYLHLNKVPINKLYLAGFYRVGCYICPSLRSWEKLMILLSPEVLSSIDRKDLLRRFIIDTMN